MKKNIVISSSGVIFVDKKEKLHGVSVNSEHPAIIEINCDPTNLVVQNFHIEVIDFRQYKLLALVNSTKIKARIIRWLINKWL